MSTLLHQTQGKPTFMVVDRGKDQILENWLQSAAAMILLTSPDPASRPRARWPSLCVWPDRLGRRRRRAELGVAGSRKPCLWSWTDIAEQMRQLQRLAARLRIEPGSLHVLWSAGKAGFTATEADYARELANYERMLGTFETVGHAMTFVHLSSAGGLYEDQRHVGPETVPFAAPALRAIERVARDPARRLPSPQ